MLLNLTELLLISVTPKGAQLDARLGRDLHAELGGFVAPPGPQQLPAPQLSGCGAVCRSLRQRRRGCCSGASRQATRTAVRGPQAHRITAAMPSAEVKRREKSFPPHQLRGAQRRDQKGSPLVGCAMTLTRSTSRGQHLRLRLAGSDAARRLPFLHVDVPVVIRVKASAGLPGPASTGAASPVTRLLSPTSECERSSRARISAYRYPAAARCKRQQPRRTGGAISGGGPRRDGFLPVPHAAGRRRDLSAHRSDEAARLVLVDEHEQFDAGRLLLRAPVALAGTFALIACNLI